MKKPLGLDWWDVALQAGITFALAVAVAPMANMHEEVPVSIVTAASLAILGVRRWWALRRWRPELTPESVDRIEQLEARGAQLEAEQGRVLELEERLDFAERLLARTGQAERQLDR